MAQQEKEFLRKLQATFRAEAEEHLQEIVSNIVQLERASVGAQKELVGRILKRLHTLKGAARAVNLADLETLCHAMEDVFSAIHASGRVLAPEQFDMIHQAGNLARSLSIEASGRIRNQAVALTARLRQLGDEIMAAGPGDEAMSDEVQPGTDAPPPLACDIEEPDDAPAEAPEMAKSDVIRVQGRNLDAIRYQAETLLSVELGLQHHINDLLALAEEIAEQRNRMHAESGSRRTAQKSRSAEKERLDGEAKGRVAEADTSISGFELRCRRLANELNRTRRNFSATRARLMDATLETALVSFSTALDQLPGMVRNLARSRGKNAVLSIQGEHAHVDRRILDIVREVLIHLVTNAVDHGIEPAGTRLAAGKPAAGAVRITVGQRSGNQVALTVADDGAGINVASVVDAATRSGMLHEEKLAGLNDQQKLHLVLHSGVSTSAQVTQVSGRGVGLAIVADKVAAVGGELHIDNAPGAGCAFTLLLPVRLATLRGLVLRVGDVRYVVPLAGIESVRRLKPGDIQTVENRETLAVGDRVLPVIRLRQLLRTGHPDPAQPSDENVALIARAGKTVFSLLVDEILAEQEVLPKTLGKQLRRVRCISGATQLGDDSLVLILGLDDIARHGLVTGGGIAADGRGGAVATSSVRRVLVVEDSITSRLLLKHILEGAGYQVKTAVDGLDALSKLRQEEFDVVVSDVEMPQLDGLRLTERIRANPKTEELPVVLVTSLQSLEEKERGLRAGADAYVVKGSFDQDNLLTTIRRLG